MKKLFAIILLLLLSFSASGQEKLRQGGWEYYELPSGDYAIGDFLPGDDLRYSVGSLSLNDPTVAECWNANQMTILVNIPHLNFVPGDGVTHMLFDMGTGGTTNRIVLYMAVTGVLRFEVHDKDATRHRVDFDISGWGIGTPHQIVCTFDFNANTIALYTDGTLRDAVPDNALSSDSIDAIESVVHYGSDYSAVGLLNGGMTIQIFDTVKDSTWVTDQYNSGDLQPTVITPDTILAVPAGETTGCVYHHSGKLVSAIANGATESTLTTSAGSDTAFSDGDAVLVQGECGDSAQGFIDGTPSSTAPLVDDGAGALVSGLSAVGVHAESEDTQYFSQTHANFPESGISGDMTIQGWFKFNTSAVAKRLVSKYEESGKKNYLWSIIPGGEMSFINSDGGWSIKGQNSTNCTVEIDRWYHLAVTVDVSDTSCIFYQDGIALTDDGVALYNSIAIDAGAFRVGAFGSSATYLDGGVFNLCLFDDIRTPAEILASATTPLEDNSAAGNIIAQWMFNDPADATVIDNTQTDAGRDLTLQGGTTTNYGTHTRTQSAYLSRNLLIDSDFENGGIGGWTVGDAATTISKSTTQIFKDSLSLKVLNGDASQAFARQTITTVANEKYRFHARYFAADTPNGASQLVDVDLAAALGVTVTQADLSAGWNEIEFCFTAADTSTTIDLGSGSVTNAEFGYWDDCELRTNLIVNGGMEGGADPPASWTQETNATVISDTSPHSGTNCLKTTAGAVNVGAKQSVTLVSGQYYTVTAYAKVTAADTASLVVDTGDTTIVTLDTTTSTTWTKIQGTFLSTGTAGVVYLQGVANGDIVWFDDVVIERNDTAAASTDTKAQPGYWPLYPQPMNVLE